MSIFPFPSFTACTRPTNQPLGKLTVLILYHPFAFTPLYPLHGWHSHPCLTWLGCKQASRHIRSMKRMMMAMKKCEKMPRVYGSVKVYRIIIMLVLTVELTGMVRWWSYSLHGNICKAISLSETVFWNAVENFILLEFWWIGKHQSLWSSFAVLN